MEVLQLFNLLNIILYFSIISFVVHDVDVKTKKNKNYLKVNESIAIFSYKGCKYGETAEENCSRKSKYYNNQGS